MTKSAVLVPIFYNNGKLHILLTRRSEKVLHHKGQIAFPGGAHNEADASLLETALRESMEEIGLDPRDAEIVGELDDTPTTTSGFIITPFVATIPYPYKFTPNPNEIAEIFDVPVHTLLRKATVRQEPQSINGEPIIELFYEYEGIIIWGATARILKQLLNLIESLVELSDKDI